MPTVTWARVDPARRAAIVEAAEAEFGVHGFSGGSLWHVVVEYRNHRHFEVSTNVTF